MITQWFLIVYIISSLNVSHTITPMTSRALCMEVGHKIVQLPQPPNVQWYNAKYYCISGQVQVL